jgi:mitochondrial cardiolipin hydrolase
MRIWMAAVLLALAMAHAGAETQAYFTSRESVEAEIEQLIERSRSSVNMALFEFRSTRLAHALARARARGVLLRIILDAGSRSRRPAGANETKTFRPGEIRRLGGKGRRGHGAMHHKFAVFDHERLITGSFNWTPGAEHVNYENILLTNEPEPVKAFEREFEALWRRASVVRRNESEIKSSRSNPGRKSRKSHRRRGPTA